VLAELRAPQFEEEVRSAVDDLRRLANRRAASTVARWLLAID